MSLMVQSYMGLLQVKCMFCWWQLPYISHKKVDKDGEEQIRSKKGVSLVSVAVT